MSIRALLCSIFGALLLDACMPADMHVNRGLDPKLADDDVRFRTTYYFRTFDYCWDFNAKMRQSSTGEDFSYRSIIPKTDTLYRYRMTGKASSTFSRIRFESGVLKAAVLDPFGTQVSFSEAADGFIVRGASEVKEAAERSAEQDRLRAGKLEQLKSLTGYYLGLDPNSASEVRTAALEALKKALEDYRGASPAPSSLEGKQLQDAIGAVEAKTTTLFAADKELSGAVAKLKGEVDAVASYNELGICRIGEKVRKGFQIMGPEGLKTYDQDDRLVVAMSSSAKPLIETLQEYAGRVLDSRSDRTGDLLALTEENLRAERARRIAADAKSSSPDAVNIIDQVIKSFTGENK